MRSSPLSFESNIKKVSSSVVLRYLSGILSKSTSDLGFVGNSFRRTYLIDFVKFSLLGNFPSTPDGTLDSSCLKIWAGNRPSCSAAFLFIPWITTSAAVYFYGNTFTISLILQFSYILKTLPSTGYWKFIETLMMELLPLEWAFLDLYVVKIQFCNLKCIL